MTCAGMQIDTFGAYVRARLEEWGREFALHRDCDYLGHCSRNLLQVLIEHRGEIPGRTQGYKPLQVDMLAQQIEGIVAGIGDERPDIACVLRAYFCGMGRRKVERYETALLLLSNVYAARGMKKPLPSVRWYLVLAADGIDMVRRRLECDD